MRLTGDLTDEAVLGELARRLERRRIDRDLTQVELAERAGVSKRTVERVEAGISTDFRLVLRILRALQLFESLDALVPDLPQSPLALLKHRGRERKRVGRRSSKVKEEPTGRKRSQPWKWGEEK